MSEKTQKKTHIALVLDRSSSMSGLREEAVTWYNEQVDEIQGRANKDNQEIHTSLVTFNDEIFEHLWDVDAKKLQKAGHNDFVPSGMTALWDAVGYTVDKLRETIDVDDEDTAFLVLVITDGHNNASNHFNADGIKKLQTSLQQSKRWTFTYMGCDENYLRKIATQTGTPISNCAAWSNRSRRHAKQGFKAASTKMGSYLKARGAGADAESLCRNFHSADNSAPADYTDVGGDADDIQMGDAPDVMKTQGGVKPDSWVSNASNGPFSRSTVGTSPPQKTYRTATPVQKEQGGGIFATEGTHVPKSYWEQRK